MASLIGTGQRENLERVETTVDDDPGLGLMRRARRNAAHFPDRLSTQW
jgi:hypothetical protein